MPSTPLPFVVEPQRLTHKEALRFARKIRLTPTGCWEWRASKSWLGYGMFNLRGRTRPAHRVTHEAVHGTVPTGLELDHLCRNRACVNPQHTERVTHRENVMRGTNVTARNARATHCIHGHPFDAANTYYKSDGGRSCKACWFNPSRRTKKRPSRAK